LELYKKPGKRKEELTYHVTAKFLNREPLLEYQNLAQPFLGKSFRIHIVGVFLTAKAFGLRIRLTEAQRCLFDEREGTEQYSEFLKKPAEDDKSASTQITELERELKSIERGCSKIKSTKVKCKSKIHSCISGGSKGVITFLPKSSTTKGFRIPSKSRAHVTIGCSGKTKAVQTGKDLLDIIDLESRINSPTPVFHQDFPIDSGTLRQFGRHGDAFVIYPCHDFFVEATFGTYI
jgi:hypothetical protein